MSDDKTSCKYFNKSMESGRFKFLKMSSKVSAKTYVAICDPNIENPKIEIPVPNFPLKQEYLSKYCENKTNFVNCYRFGLITEETKKQS